MYPDFYQLFKDLFGIDIHYLSLLKTFGFLVAMAFIAGGYIIYKELKRKEDAGLVGFTIDEITIGKPSSITDFITSALLGFLIGYKLIGMFLDWKISSPDPLSYLFSAKGNLVAGITFLVLSVLYKWYSEKGNTAETITTKKVKTYPHTRVGDIAMIAALGGFTGAKIFNAMETWDDFIKDPIASLISSSGLTFYGGLIVATFALWYFSRRIKLDFRHLCDAAAPALILAYGIGRLGCQVSGDGDWGIYNSAYISDSNAKVVKTAQPFEKSVMQFHEHIYRHFNAHETIPHAAFEAPSFLPTWFVAYNYPHNVNNIGIPLPNYIGDYGSVLPIPVYPTPVYEFIMCSIIFLILWKMRLKIKTPLGIFSVYLIFNGMERFLIEQIRVNYKYDWGFIQPTQAEIIAVCIMLCGVLLFVSKDKIDALVNRSNSAEIPSA